MVRYFLILFALLFTTKQIAQEITGAQLLEKAIEYHDPTNQWPNFNNSFVVKMSTPNGKERKSNITINLPKSIFKLTTIKENTTTTLSLVDKNCQLALNGSTNISEEDVKKHRLTCDRANMYKNYYTFLYGLPMKLKDAGTIIDPIVHTKTFKGKTYLILKVTYEKLVGNDTWYFYFNPKTYAMEVYQFFHDEAKNDGEYILLSGEEEISGIKMPKTRAWYYNKNDDYLATDILAKSKKQ